MALRASASIVTPVTPREVLELVLDLDRYRQADSKILTIRTVDGPDENGRGEVRLWSRLKFTPPAPDEQIMQLERWRRLTFSSAPRQPLRLIFRFTGTVECQPTRDGTVVTHTYELTFRAPFRILETVHRRWLQEDVEEEMRRMADILDPAAPGVDQIVRPGRPRARKAGNQ